MLLFCFNFFIANSTKTEAAVGINRQINFQGKLVNPNGTNVTDGTYTIVFSVYTVSTAGTAIWTETQTPTVTQGIFQVTLGSVTALPGSIDFNTDNIYLGVKVGADAEMSPRIRFTAVPQAFNSEKLGGIDNTGFIQNTTTQQASTNFNISGNGTAGTSFTTPLLQSAAATALNITGNAASTWSTTAGNITIQAGSGTVSLGTTTNLTANGALTINATNNNLSLQTTTSGDINLTTATATALVNVLTGNLKVGNGTPTVALNGEDGYVEGTFEVDGNTDLAGNVTIAGSTTISATGTALTLSGAATTAINITNTGVTTDINLQNSEAIHNNTDGDITFTRSEANSDSISIRPATGAATFAGVLTNTDLTSARTWTLPNASGTLAVSASGNIALSALGDITFTGTLPVANGGTGATTHTAGGILFGNGTSAFANSGVLTNGQLLIGDGAGAPTIGTLTAGTGISITNGAGTISIASTVTDTNTTYTAGNDLDLSGTTFNIEPQLDFVSTINQTSANLTLQTTTSGNIILNSAGTIELQDNTNVTGALAVTGNGSFGGRQLTLSNFYPEYRWRFGGGTDLNWKTIANISLGTGAYVGATYQVDVTDANTNLGSTANAIPMRFYVSALRSLAVQDDQDTGTVAGPSTDYVRLVKTALGVYELQVRQTLNYRHLDVTARMISTNGVNTLAYVDNPADGSTVGTIYTSSTTGYTQEFPNIDVNGNFVQTGTGTFTTGTGGNTLNGSTTLSGATTISVASGTGLNFSNTGLGTDINLQNGETIDNDTDGTIRLTAANVNLTGALQTGGTTRITSTGVLQNATWNGSSITDAYIDNNLTIDWTGLQNYPTGCAAGTAVTTIGDTITCTAFAPASGGNYIAKNASDTSSFAVTASNFLYTFTNTSSAVASGVLRVDNGTNTGSAISVIGSGNAAANNAYLFAKNSNATPSGNLIDLQNNVASGTSVFNVSATGSTTLRSTTNSTTAFSVSDSNNTALLTANTTNRNLTVNQGNLYVTNFGTPATPTVAVGSNQGGTFSGAAGTTYYYKVTALNAAGESLASGQSTGFASTSFTPLSVPGAATVAINATAGNLNGTYQYQITFVTANGETTGGTTSATVSPVSQQVNLSAIPIGPTGTTQRKIYRCVTSSCTYALVATLADNSTTTYLDNIAAPSGALPGSNTARTNLNNLTISYSNVTGATSYRIYRYTTSNSTTGNYQTDSDGTPFTDTGAAGTGATIPATSTSGSVGIGTTTASASLHVAGNALFKNAGNTTTAFQIQSSGNATSIFNVDTTNERIGIGTNAPTAKLDVVGIGTTSALVVSTSATPTTDLVSISNTAGTAPTASGINAAQILWYTRPASGNTSSAFRITVDNDNTAAGGQVQGIRIAATGAGGAIASDTVGLIIDNLTSPSTGTALENAIEIGTGWDNGIYGTGALNIRAAGTSVLTVDTTGAGTLTLGTNATTLNLGAGTVNETINVGTGSGTDILNLLTDTGTNTLNIGASASSATAINIYPGTGDMIVSLLAGAQARFAATVAPTGDLVVISNTGFPNVTAGASGLQVDYIGGAAAVEASAQRINLTAGTTSGGTWNGQRVDLATAPVAGVTVNLFKAEPLATGGAGTYTVLEAGTITTPGAGQESVLNVGTGYDAILRYNGTTLINGTGILQSAAVSGSYTGITGVGTLTAGTWNGAVITDAYVNDTLTVSSAGSVAWAALNAYPAACAAGQAITALNDTPTCSTFATTDTNTTYSAGNDLDLTGTTFDIESQLDFVSTINRTSSNLTLQTTTSGNIILNSAGTIELQDNTNITGNLDVSGTITGGSANQFTVSAAGAVTAVGVNAGTGTFTGTGGATISGAAVNLNNNSNFAVNINTGTSTGTTTMGNNSNAANAIIIDGGTAASSIQIGNTTTAHGIQIGTSASAAQTIVIGSTNAGSALTLQGGAGITATGDIVASGAATGTTGTTEAVARTDVTTVTLTAAGAFANNDVIFINNAGQDFYTRIISGGGTVTLTVDLPVDYDASAPVTKYAIQNIGAKASTYTTLSNRFYQGYFLGGVVLGAGSTTLSDGNIYSTQTLNLQHTGNNVAIGGLGQATSDFYFNNNTGQFRINSLGASGRLTLAPVSAGTDNLWNIDNSAGTLRFFRENYSSTGGGTGGAVKLAITDAGEIAVDSAGKISFGSAVGDKLNLYGNTYGIGIESNTMTFWSNDTYRWRIGGTSVSTGTAVAELRTNGLSTASLHANSGIAPSWNGQGLYIAWNRNVGEGETDFINNRGSGVGAFRWYNTSDTTNGTQLALLNNQGTFVASGQLWGTLLGISDTSGVSGTTACRGTGSFLGIYNVGFCTSLQKYKNNTTNLSLGIETLRQLRPVEFDWNIASAGYAHDLGFIAEEVEAVNPILAEYADGKLTGVKYNLMTSLLTKSIQQLDLQVQNQQTSINTIQNQLNNGTFNNISSITVSGAASLGSLTVTGDAEVSGTLTVIGDTTVANLYVGGKLISKGNVPATALGSALTGVLGANVTNTGTDTAGSVSIVSGTQTAQTGVLAEVTFTSAYATAPKIVISGNNAKSAKLGTYVTRTATGFKLVTDEPLEANIIYEFDYVVIGAEN